MLAFYGDWTQAPIFDEEYYDTNKDELNEGLDIQDKVMADAYATRVIGSLYSDYIVTLGAYPFKQDPMATQIAANKDRIAISNQRDESEEGNNSTANAVSDVWAGLLRNAKEVEISIIEDSTGEEVFYRSEKNQHKSYNYSGSIGSSAIEIDFSAIENNLKNNTRYTVTLSAYIDYGTKETQNNKRNTFTFPLYIDIEAPAVTDVRYRSEYDKSTKKTKLYADIDIYDNHYAMGMQIGQIVPSEDPKYTFSMDTFGKYITPVYSTFNSTSTVTVELTDYIDRIKKSIGMDQNSPTASEVEKNNNSFIAVCYDYALNVATYEIRLPDEILSAAFKEDTISLQEGKTKDLIAMMDIYPMDSWAQTLDFVVENPLVAEIVNGTVIAKQAGETVIRAIKKDGKDNQIEMASVNLVVTSKSGGFDGITEPVNKFELTGYYTNKAYHGNSNDDREIGETDSNNAFGKDGAVLSMFPSESVTVQYTLDSYFPDDTKVVFESMNEEVATVDPETGTIIAQKKGTTYISADVYFREDGEWDTTFYSAIITVKVKDPFTVNGMYLYSYKGLGGVVEIPDDRSITMIYQYAFSNYEYIPKDENDVIDEEDPYFIKPWYIGEDTITKVIIPEGITTIESYAFASLTALEEVVLPKSLVRIGVGAFTGCTKLRKINLENVKFINEEAFKDCPLSEVALDSVVSIGNYTFQNTEITSLHLPESSQSLGIGAFADNTYLYDVSFAAAKMKIGSRAFENCKILNNITVNAAVIASYAFYNCKELDTITLGKDVAIIGEFAFTGTNIAQFNVEEGSQIIVDPENKACLLKDGELIMIAPKGATYTFTTSATTIAAGALAGNTKIEKVVAKEVETIGSYAFAECPNLEEVDMPAVKSIGDYAFAGTKLKQMPTSKDLTKIGNYAFAGTLLKEVKLVDNAVVGEYAFGGYETVSRYVTETLEKVEIGNGVKLGKGVFYAPIYLATYDNVDSLYYYDAYQYYLQDKDGNYIDKDGNIVSDKSQAKSYTYYRYDYKTSGIIPSVLTSISIGENVIIGENAFAGNAKIKELTIGNGSVIEDYAFMNAAFYDETVLNSIDLSGVVKIGQYAFSGTSLQDYQEIETLGKTEDEPITSIVPAYNLVYVPGENGKEGEEKILGYKLSTFAPIFKEVDLSGATELGEGAFAYNKNLEKVTFNDSLTSISNYAFALCSSLESVELPASVTSIGEYAFYLTGLVGDTLNLQNVDVIGDYAFAQTGLTNVSFKDGATIGEAAFNSCENLTGVDLSNVLSIGASAFRETALKKADLTSAEYVGDFAFGESKVTEVVFGTNIKEFGENPFYGCAMETYGKEESVEFNGAVISTTIVDTYKINDKVEIIDGVLYQKVKTGLELVSYPMLKEDKTYKVVEGTARITARAFYGSKIENVTLPLSLKALGDKAFFDCNSLSVVVFKSYDAPILEEDYDTSRLAYENLPMTGRIGEYVGLGIVKYYMWNPTAQFTNFYFGANFVDFIGDVDGDLVMVKPANGRKYNTFIFSQYFKTVVEGSNAATDETINVIALINAIPSRVSLTDEETIVTAREAYDKITSFEQRALIAEVYPKLSNAESTLEYLKANAGQGDSSDSSEPEDSSTDSTVSSGEQSDANVSTNTNGYVVAIVCLSIAVVGVGCFAIFAFMRKGAGASKETENSGDNADEVNNSDNQE
jgi:acetyltransferase-like isoleucine patch superfamily enzyme